ncbi:hypothetical protein ACWCRD_02900 [Streptomyces sp. NPDC002092]
MTGRAEPLADFLALLDEASREAREREAAYRAWLDRKLPELAEELTATLPADLRAAGIRFEWATTEEQQ